MPQAKLQDGVILPKIQFQVIESTKQSIDSILFPTANTKAMKIIWSRCPVLIWVFPFKAHDSSLDERNLVCKVTTNLSKFYIESKITPLLYSEVKIHDWDIYLLVRDYLLLRDWHPSTWVRDYLLIRDWHLTLENWYDSFQNWANLILNPKYCI